MSAIASFRPPTETSSHRWWSAEVRWCLLLSALALALYGRTVAFSFINFDDDVHVYENPFVRGGLSLSGLAWAFQIHGPSQWHPLAWISHQLDWQIYGAHPAGHHATNVVLHLLGVILLFFALRELLGRTDAAGFIAAMFAVHPLNIESVAWVSERRNVLCGVFWMLALWSYTRYARQGGWRRYLQITCWVALALMSKPLAVTLPCVFCLLDFWPLRRCSLPLAMQPTASVCLHDPCPTQPWSVLVIEKLPWFLLSAGASWLSYLCQEHIQVVSSLSALPLRLRLENACAAYGLYLRRMVWPTDLAVFYPHPAWHHPQPEQALLVPALCGAGLILGITGFAFWNLRRHPGLAVGWFWFLGTLVPMIGLVQVGQQQLADRYVYIPMIGLGLMAVSLPIPSRISRLVPRLCTLLIAAWFGASLWQLGYWRNSQTLFAHTVAVTTDNSWAHLNLGLALAGEHRYNEAIQNYQLALNIDPNYALAHYNLGVVWHDLGQLNRAIPSFEQALALNDRDVNAWIRLGAAIGQRGDLPRAETCFHRAVVLDERSAQARHNLGLVLQARGNLSDALSQLEQSVELAPENVSFRTSWMLALHQAGQVPAARRQAEEILKIDPASTPARRVLSR